MPESKSGRLMGSFDWTPAPGEAAYLDSRVEQLVDIAGGPDTVGDLTRLALRRAAFNVDRTAFEAGFDAAIASLHIPNVLFTHPKYLADRARLYLDYVRSRKAASWEPRKP